MEVIDTFKDYVACFQHNLDRSLEEKIGIWENCYMSQYPEIEKRCKEDYESNGYNWRQIAENMVFNRTREDFDKMIMAYGHIIEIIYRMNKRVSEVFCIDLDLNIVLYSGLGNSAGWVDKYKGKRAILYGIDKIAQLNWHKKEQLEALISHELCHVVHFQIRGEDGLADNIDRSNYNLGIWNIYVEGFAQFFQYKLLDKEIDSRGRQWLEDCMDKKSQFKQLYLKALYERQIGTRNFFGDWYEVMGISDVGYFLGSEFIASLYKSYGIDQIARLDFIEIEGEVMKFLREKL